MTTNTKTLGIWLRLTSMIDGGGWRHQLIEWNDEPAALFYLPERAGADVTDIGSPAGEFIRIAGDGAVQAGRYNAAFGEITSAVFTTEASQQFHTFEDALEVCSIDIPQLRLLQESLQQWQQHLETRWSASMLEG